MSLSFPPRRHTNSVKWDECEHPDMLPLWVADMDIATAPCVQEAVMRRATHGCYGYTLVPDSYYRAIGDWYATRHQWNIDSRHILYTIGVVPAIAAVLKAQCQTGDNVAIVTPVYNIFYNLIRNAGCQAKEVPVVEHLDQTSATLTYDIDWEGLESALQQERTTVLLWCNPHNPIGRIWSDDELYRVAQMCVRYRVTLVCDEIHNDVTAPHLQYVPLGRVVAQHLAADPALAPLQYVVCLSPSKSFNMAGLQNAFMVCPDDELRRRIDRAINLNETCDVNPFGIEAVTAAYTEGGEWLDEVRAYIYDNYLYARRALSTLTDVHVADLQGTYLMWVDCRTVCRQLGVDSDTLVRRLMLDVHVWLCAGSAYGMAGEGHLRINLACERATLAEALRRIVEYLTAALSHE